MNTLLIEPADILRSLRRKSGKAQNQVASEIGLSSALLNKYETGIIQNIPRHVIEKLADYYNVSPCFIMGWETHKMINSSINIGRDNNGTITTKINKAPTLSIEEQELIKLYKNLSGSKRLELWQKIAKLKKEE